MNGTATRLSPERKRVLHVRRVGNVVLTADEKRLNIDIHAHRQALSLTLPSLTLPSRLPSAKGVSRRSQDWAAAKNVVIRSTNSTDDSRCTEWPHPSASQSDPRGNQAAIVWACDPGAFTES